MDYELSVFLRSNLVEVIVRGQTNLRADFKLEWLPKIFDSNLDLSGLICSDRQIVRCYSNSATFHLNYKEIFESKEYKLYNPRIDKELIEWAKKNNLSLTVLTVLKFILQEKSKEYDLPGIEFNYLLEKLTWTVGAEQTPFDMRKDRPLIFSLGTLISLPDQLGVVCCSDFYSFRERDEYRWNTSYHALERFFPVGGLIFLIPKKPKKEDFLLKGRAHLSATDML